ncbi:MAG: UDP-N-acetylmuramoyl-L-alanine--D-glutamate ligase [Candidatus Nomurabacteria bacterium]|nr:UDP-N-acetylmuramoyl-L-alanine--D-glutamate ligase [Candidatus Nomurabacteria bacterium]
MKTAVLGYGIEGKSAERYLKKHALAGDSVEVFDEFDMNTLDLSGFDTVVRSPSVSPLLIKGNGLEVTSSTKIFFNKCPAPIIGVTGTKGKGTTCSLIASILRAAGRTVHLVGNIGVPALDELDKVAADDIVVYELSSFQLWDLDKSPHIAVVVHIEPDHLNVHSDYDEYIDAKANIVKYQSVNDFVVYDSTNSESVKIAEKSAAKKLPYPSKEYASFDDFNLLFSEQVICSISDLKVPGEYNKMNALAAISAAWQYTKNPADYQKGLSSFTGLPHRINLVREVDGVKYYDNSISTVPGSAVADIESFKEPKVMIIGGSDKGADMSALVQAIKGGGVRQTILIGQSADGLEKQLESVGVENFINLGVDTSMNEIVRWAADSAEPGDVVILSPAHASFDMFKSYSDRGDQFVTAVQALSTKNA